MSYENKKHEPLGGKIEGMSIPDEDLENWRIALEEGGLTKEETEEVLRRMNNNYDDEKYFEEFTKRFGQDLPFNKRAQKLIDKRKTYIEKSGSMPSELPAADKNNK